MLAESLGAKMDLVKEFFRGKTPARLLMIAAIVLLLVSQFFLYLDDPSSAFLSIGGDYSSTLYIYDFGAKGTGWDLHPHAYVILVVLAFGFLSDDIADHPLFVRFGWWAALVLVIAATVPGAYLRAFGGSLGGISVLMAIGATLLHVVETRRPGPARTPPTS
jgi:hypothetical protein